MVIEELHERVAVLGKFDGGSLMPMLLRWQGRRYWVQKVNLHHTQRRGTDVLHFYGITTEAGDCVLKYSQENLSWMLESVHFEG